jgi:16S rRNA (uracil1498-N3)-methyltransferase
MGQSGTVGPGLAPDPALVAAAAMVFVDDLSSPLLSQADAHHLLDVLRLRPDEPVVASDGAGGWVTCRLGGAPAARTRGAPAAVSLEVDGRPTHQARTEPAITVAFAPTKGDRPEWVTQKLTELGVDRIVPIHTGRSVVRWEGERGERAVTRLRRVATEAAAQSRRPWLPEVAPVATVAALAERSPVPPVLAHPGGGLPSLSHPVVAVGPEGGWDDDELARWGHRMGLGPTVLRAETAAVAAGTVLCGLRSGLVGTLA